MTSRILKGAGFLALSYFVLYLVYALLDFLPKWDAYGPAFLRGDAITGYAFVDPLFLLIPFVGFVGTWLLMDAYLHHFRDTFVVSIPFALVLVIVSYVSFFLALLGYYWNNAFLVAVSRNGANPGFASLGPAIEFVLQNFMDLLLQSPFFLMVLAALLGWLSYVLIHSFLDEPLPGSHASHPPALHAETPQHN